MLPQPIDSYDFEEFNLSLNPVYPAPHVPMLLEVLHERIRAKHYSPKTGRSYAHWIKRFVFFHHKKHPRDMGAPEVEAFLTDLAVNGKVSSATQFRRVGKA